MSQPHRRRRQPIATSTPAPAARLLCLSIMLLLVTSVMLLVGCGGDGDGGARRGPRMATNIPAPDFNLLSLTGDWIQLANLRGQVVLVDFWGTWCGPCRRSIPHLTQIYADYAASGFEIIGIAVNDREETVRRYVEHARIDYPVCLGDGSVEAQYGIQNVPTAFLIDREGRITARYVGYQQKSVIEEAVRGLIGIDG